MGHCQKLQDIADASEGYNRHTSNASMNETLDYIYDTVARRRDYWDVELQFFNVRLISSFEASFNVSGTSFELGFMTFSPAGTFPETEVVVVDRFGCEASDFPNNLQGKIALISRGECTFSLKSINAGAAGAVAAVVYNNVAGVLSGTLGDFNDSHVPIAGMSQEDGLALVEQISSGGGSVTADCIIDPEYDTIYTKNIIATSKAGEKEDTLFLGAHADSVTAGPGINDNGSGTSALLAIAEALPKFKKPSSRIRLAWWSAEEDGLLGSEYYVDVASNETLEDIRVYINFDMIASPNYVLGVYDGSGAAFNLSGPPGSAEVQALFEDFFESKGFPSVPTEFTGRSDYGPFLDVGVPCGGLFTGAEQNKTEEQAALFGGEANVAYDVNYHLIGDDINNLNLEAFEINAKAVAHSVATYGRSFEGFPERETFDRRVKFTKRSHLKPHELQMRGATNQGLRMSCSGIHGDFE